MVNFSKIDSSNLESEEEKNVFSFTDIDESNFQPTPEEKNTFSFTDIDESNFQPTPLVIPDNTIDLGYNFDGSKKYTFDDIYKNKELIKIAKEFYEERDDIEFDNDKDVIDEYINDRTWKQANISSATWELYDVKNTMSPEQLKRLGYLTEYWYSLPNFWEEGGRSASSAIYQNLKAGILDWTNLASAGVGALVTKSLGKQALKGLTSDQIKKQILKSTAKATAVTSAFDASVFAAGDLAIQEAEKELGLRKEFDFKRTGVAAIMGGGISALPNGLANYGFLRLKADIYTIPKEPASPTLKQTIKELDKETGDTVDVTKELVDFDELGKTRTGKVKEKLFAQSESKKSISYGLTYAKQLAFDKDHFHKLFQYAYTGVSGSPKGLRAGLDIQEPVSKELQKHFAGKTKGEVSKDIDIKFSDPSQFNYIKTRELASSSVRSDDFVERGPMILRNMIDPEDGKVKAEYVPTGTKGLMQILKPYDEVGEGHMFINYIAAKRSLGIIQRNETLLALALKDKKTPVLQDTPFTPKGKGKMSAAKQQELAKKKIQEIIDYGELSSAQYKSLYGFDGKHAESPSFLTGIKEWKKFFDDMLDYAESKGLHSAEDITNMKEANPYGYIPFKTIKDTFVEGYDAGTDKVIKGIMGSGVTRKRKKLIKGGRLVERTKLAPFLRSSTDYVHHLVKAADANDAKLSFYRMHDNLPDAEKKLIAEKLTGKDLTQVKDSGILTEPLIKKMEHMGFKIDATGVEKDIADKISSAAFHSSMRNVNGEVFDVVYRDGVRQIYKINSALLKDSLLSEPKDFGPFWNKVWSNTKYISRLPARAITFSPPFVAFNFIRDSLSATVNSAFDFWPGMSSFKGLMLTFKGNADGSNMLKYQNAVQKSNEFKNAIVAGLGQTTRKDVEAFGGILNNLDVYGTTAANGWYRKTINYMKETSFGRGARSYADFVSKIEYASRYAEYNFAKKAGLSSTAAAFMGREVSTDFAMRGSWKFLNNYSSVTMFFNAGLQGFYRGMRVFLEGEGLTKAQRIKRITKRRAGVDVSRGTAIDALSDLNARALGAIGAVVVAPELTLHIRNRDLPEYQDVPDEVKMLHYLWPVYEEDKADGSHLHADGTRRVKYFNAVPKPYDFGVFGNIATGIYEGIMNKSPGLAVSYITKSFSMVMPGIASPTLANPWIHIMLNENWLGDEILPHGYKRLPGELQTKSNTRRSAQVISDFILLTTGKAQDILAGAEPKTYKGITFPPIILDYIMSSYFTGLASYPLDLIDASLWDEKTFGAKPTARSDIEDLANQPWSIVTRRFKVDTPVKNAKGLQIFYDTRNRARKLKAGVQYSMSDLESVLKLKFNNQLSSTEVREAVGISPYLEMISLNLMKLRDKSNAIKFKKNYTGFDDVPISEYMTPDGKRMSEQDIKKKDMDFLMQKQNEIANMVVKSIRDTNFETIQKDIFGYSMYEETENKSITPEPSVVSPQVPFN
tara:strand:+ start:2841 stop:7256 length:4416 start_codon:yes stop_codon:yes gene_type:complete